MGELEKKELSREVTGIIEVLRQVKAASQGVELTAEMIPSQREQFDRMSESNPIGEGITVEHVSVGGQAAEFYHYDADDQKQEEHILLYFHGGAFMNGSVFSRRFLASNLASFGKVDAVSVEYTQWPEGRHPIALEESVKVFHALEEMGYPAKNIYVAGESAGATLALALTHWLKNHGEDLPAKIVAISPVIDLAEEYPSRRERADRDPLVEANISEIIRCYFDGCDYKDPYISVKYGDFTGFPETFITVGTEEVLYDDAIDLHKIMDEAGVPNQIRIYDGLFHAFQMIPSPESMESIKELGDFLRADCAERT